MRPVNTGVILLFSEIEPKAARATDKISSNRSRSGSKETGLTGVSKLDQAVDQPRLGIDRMGAHGKI